MDVVEWQEAVSNMTTQAAVVALDAPVRLQFQMDLSAALATGGDNGTVTNTTLVQYSGGRNPYWPSPYSSSDIISLTITPSHPPPVTNRRRQLAMSGSGGGSDGGGGDGIIGEGRGANNEETGMKKGGVRRLESDSQTTSVTPAVINITFETSTFI